jgi:hypothetical protein
VFDPAGINPIYNVIVYIPNSDLDPITHGATCDKCSSVASGNPITATLTTADGSFTLENAPSGTDIPLVLQIGKWRRQFKIPTVTACQTNAVPVALTHLPRHKNDGDPGTVSLPRIAIPAGNAHPQELVNGSKKTNEDVTERLQCLLRRIGVDASEFTLPSGTGSIHLYNQSVSKDTCKKVEGSATEFPDATGNLWDTQEHLNQYDLILLNCAGALSAANPNNNNDYINHPGAVERMKAYVDAGGRVFAEHYHWSWVKSFGSSYPSVFGNVATWLPNDNDVIGSVPRDTYIDTTIPRAAAFADWLVNTGASLPNERGHLTISSGVKTTAIDTINPPAQRWIYEPANTNNPTGEARYTHYFTINTPIEATVENQCGRFVYTALHVSDSSGTGFPGDPVKSGNTVLDTFPACCNARTQLSPQEKALEFMIFDLSSCYSVGEPIIPIIPPPATSPPPAPPAPSPPAPPAAPPASVPPPAPAPPAPPAPVTSPPTAPPPPVSPAPPPPPPPSVPAPPPAPPPSGVTPPPPVPPPPPPILIP